MVRLYGKGAVVLAHGHTEYRPVEGVLTVPPQLVDRARALGFSPHRPAGMEEPSGPAGPVTAVLELPKDHPAASTAAAIAQRERKAADRAEQRAAPPRR